ncbi:hypothetical protein L2E82_14102 [Cichorium intybus]|uniref:Uncharacterized protein n=1 Tax=Cichorium intybus TaxID=13427 RepID=A0ACB9EYR3_CICIN|nr:hypothetical protein L2E82_14102 [Cichorium intybus]
MIFKRLTECKLKEGSNINSHVLQIEAYIGELYKLGYPMSQEESVNILLTSLTNEYDLFIQTYRKEDQKKTLMEMRPLLTLYESLLDRHSSNGSTTSGLSPVKRHNKKRSRSTGHVSNWESAKSDTVTGRLEDAPTLLKAQTLRSRAADTPVAVCCSNLEIEHNCLYFTMFIIREDNRALVETDRSSITDSQSDYWEALVNPVAAKQENLRARYSLCENLIDFTPGLKTSGSN